jgi:nucleotide-binding universal stress UspA family protein
LQDFISEHQVIQIRRILVPTDFSKIARHALEHAIVIGRWYRSNITALHVGNPMILFGTVAPVPPTMVEALAGDSNRGELETEVRNWLSPAAAAGLATDAIVEQGNPARCILAHARSLPADLIVIGTHGHGAFERLVLGSVAEKVLRKAPCPVLTIPPRQEGSSALPFAHVLCPIDFSDSSIAALQHALSLVQESNARLTLLHVFEWSSDEATAKRVLESSDYHRQLEAETREHLERLIPTDARNWCAPETRLAFGKAYQQILGLAESEHVDLIVMGVRGRNPFDLMMFGSTVNQVVRQARCPVLTRRT